MNDKKIFIVIIFALAAGLVLFVSSRPVEKNEWGYRAAISQEANIARLESQVQQLRGLISAFVQLNRSLRASFQEEKQQRETLQQALAEAALQNESLGKELNRARLSMELTLPIKQGIDKIEGSLAAVQAAPGKEKELKQKLQDINRQLELIDAQIPGLLKENASYKRLSETQSGLLEKQERDIAALRGALDEEGVQRRMMNKELDILKMAQNKGAELEKIKNNLLAANASLNAEVARLNKELKGARLKLSQAAREKESLRISTKNIEEAKIIKQDNQRLQEQLRQLQAQFAQAQKDSANLQNEYALLQETLKRNEGELGRRADKILVLGEELADIQMKLAGIQSQYNEQEKESASLRERNVAVQLEREGLKEQLSQAKIKLSDLENQLAQIGVILKAPGTAEPALPKEGAPEETKRVEVELYPAETASAEETR